MFEIFRISGMLTSDMHLFALAINQFIGTMWPLKYKVSFFIYYYVHWPRISNFMKNIRRNYRKIIFSRHARNFLRK